MNNIKMVSVVVVELCAMHEHHAQYIGIGLILGLHTANERRRYFVTTSLISWAQA